MLSDTLYGRNVRSGFKFAMILLTTSSALAARQVSVPMPIPGTDSDFIAPSIGEIRIYFILLSAVGTVATALMVAFIHRLNQRLDRIEYKLDVDAAAQAANQERFR